MNFMKIFNCKKCNKEVTRYAINKGFCSQSCSNRARKGFHTLELICKTCTKKFKVRKCESKNRLYCSLLCVFSSEEYRKKHSDKIGLFKKGSKHWNWKGGITPSHLSLRASPIFQEFKRKIRNRDNYTCQKCGIRGVRLDVDHIRPFSLFPELRLDASNCRTLCRPCHIKTDTWAGKVFNYQI